MYQINEVSRDCSEWAPDVSTQDEEVEFEQTQSCVVNYASAEPYNYTVNETDTQQAMGTKETIKCYYDSNNRYR